ncbi:MAG: DNA translocase FtsK [Planctomycetota bacterium]
MKNRNYQESTAVVTGLGLVCLALFAGVSLYSYSPYDVLDYHVIESQDMANKAGLVGAQLAHHALCMYGIGAWVITILMLIFGAFMCATRSLAGTVVRTCGAILLVAIVCAWCGAINQGTVFSDDYPAGPGGLIGGTFIAPPLISYFGRVGVFLILATASLLASLLLAQSLTEAALALVGRGMTRGLQLLIGFVLGRVPSVLSEGGEPVIAGAANGAASVRMPRVPEAIGEEAHFENVRPPVTPETQQVRMRQPRLAEKNKEAAEENEAEQELTDRVSRRLKSDTEKLKDERKALKADEKERSEAEETERRRQEAMRQAEVAEAERLEREKQKREQCQREAIVLEKLEKERAAHDREKAKQQEKFAAAMAEAAAANPTADDAQPSDKPKPQLPVQYDLPKYDLLIENDITPPVTSDTLKERGATVIQTLWDFKIGAKLAGIQSGPTVTMYELELDPGIKVKSVVNLQDNLAMAMKAENGVRIIAPIPGKNTIGIEIPNMEEHTVRMRPIMESPQFRSRNWTLPLILGRDAVGNPLIADLYQMPHLLIAGTTGSGKSVCVNSIILSIMLLRKPHEVKLILVDPKQVEMTDFKGIPHLLSPVVTDMKLAAGVLTWAVQKMENRYERMSRVGVRNIGTFNRLTTEERLARLPQNENPNEYAEAMPYIVIVVDEFADLMMTSGNEIDQAIARLSQKARAAGIHVILATQRPSVNVVTGLIKANLPCRICFQVKSKIDSRIVLEHGGAEKLAGKGDMLFMGAGNSNLVRAKGVYISDEEIRKVVESCKQQAEPVYSEEVERVAAQVEESQAENRQATDLDEKFNEAVEVFLACGRASTSLLQRRMSLGYTRAAKLCDQMEARGIVGPDRGAKGRELLITQESWDQLNRVRANNNGSAFGPKGSKDNPINPNSENGNSAFSSDDDDAIVAVANDSGAQPGNEINSALLAQLSPIDGVKDPGEDD